MRPFTKFDGEGSMFDASSGVFFLGTKLNQNLQ